MTDDPPSNLPLVEVGRYARLSEARERALVVAAMELPHWVVRDGPGFVLRVEPAAREAVVQELEKFEAEQAHRAASHVPEKPLPRIETLSLYVAAWLLGTCWLLQNLIPEKWEEAGAAASVAIIRDGEWWRALTALTLHGDISHLVANIASGLLFSAFVLPHLGTGVTWLLIVASGMLGNVVNAFFYRDTPHISIGSSTAVFGALGLLVACDFVARVSSPHTRSRWQLVLPLGAGLALLAFLGVGDEEHKQTDYMAHLWGFCAGLALGFPAAAAHVRERLSTGVQRVAALAAPLLIVAAWWLAVERVR
jgi:membrane associated rhomboid family serine protease